MTRFIMQYFLPNLTSQVATEGHGLLYSLTIFAWVLFCTNPSYLSQGLEQTPKQLRVGAQSGSASAPCFSLQCLALICCKSLVCYSMPTNSLLPCSRLSHLPAACALWNHLYARSEKAMSLSFFQQDRANTNLICIQVTKACNIWSSTMLDPADIAGGDDDFQ